MLEQWTWWRSNAQANGPVHVSLLHWCCLVFWLCSLMDFLCQWEPHAFLNRHTLYVWWVTMDHHRFTVCAANELWVIHYSTSSVEQMQRFAILCTTILSWFVMSKLELAQEWSKTIFTSFPYQKKPSVQFCNTKIKSSYPQCFSMTYI